MDNKPSAPIAQKMLAISGTLALIVFLVVGFAFGGWAYAWVAFLVPGMIRTWMAVEAPTEKPKGYGINDDGSTKAYPHE